MNSNQFSFKDYLIKNNDCKQSNTLPVHASNIKCQSTPKKHILNLKEAFLNSTNILKNKIQFFSVYQFFPFFFL